MRIGLVLSGGMGKGAYQIGALKALSTFYHHNDFDCFSCSSIGVLNGYAFSTGNLKTAENIWMNVCQGSNRVFISRIAKSQLLQDTVAGLVETKRRLFSPFFCSLLNYSSKTLIYKDISLTSFEQLPAYLMASVAIPSLSGGILIDNQRFFDGAFVDNIPVYPLINKPLDYIICIYFDDYCYRFENIPFDSKIIKISFSSQRIVKQSLILTKADIYSMIADGYETASRVLDSVFTDLSKKADNIRERIIAYNQNNKSDKMRITVDVLATNLNKITAKITNKTIAEE